MVKIMAKYSELLLEIILQSKEHPTAMRADNCLKHPAFSDGLTDNNPSGSSPEDG